VGELLYEGIRKRKIASIRGSCKGQATKRREDLIISIRAKGGAPKVLSEKKKGECDKGAIHLRRRRVLRTEKHIPPLKYVRRIV